MIKFSQESTVLPRSGDDACFWTLAENPAGKGTRRERSQWGYTPLNNPRKETLTRAHRRCVVSEVQNQSPKKVQMHSIYHRPIGSKPPVPLGDCIPIPKATEVVTCPPWEGIIIISQGTGYHSVHLRPRI